MSEQPAAAIGEHLEAAMGQQAGIAMGEQPGAAMSEQEDNVDRDLFRNVEKLRQLRIEHRDLDDVISRIAERAPFDQLQMQRLKKRKLALKDQILKIESQLLPDIIA